MNFSKKIIALLLAISIITGQLFKLPVFGNSGPTILDLTITLFIIYALFKLKFRLTSPPAFIIFALLFSFITVMSLALTPLNLTLNEYLISGSYILRFFIYILFCWVIYSGSIFKQEEISQLLIFSGFSTAILGTFQFLFLPDLRFLINLGWDPHYLRAASTFLDPNFLGAFLVITLLLVFQKLTFNKKWGYLIFTLIYLTLILTFSRSSYLMFTVGFLTLSIFKKSLKIALLTIILSAILFLSFNTYTQLISKPRNIDRGQSANSRLNTWQQGLALFQRSPLLGVGFNSYRFALKEYGLAKDDFLQTRGASTNDSSILYVLATTGIVGISFYILFLSSLLRHAYIHLKNIFSLILISSISGLLVHSIFNNSLFYPFILIPLLLITCAIPKK